MSDDGQASERRDRGEDGAWQRFLDQKTTPQRLLLALAALVGAVATLGAAGYGASALFDGGQSTDDGGAARERVKQGSPAADRLVKRLLAADGGRVVLDQIVEAPTGTVPFEHGDIRLLYNCKGRPVGDDHCTLARLQLSDHDSRKPDTVDRTAAHYKGTYGISVTRGTIYGSELDIVIDNVAL